MSGEAASGLSGLRVLALESRRAKEMAELIRRHGGEPVLAAALREVALAEQAAARELWRELEDGRVAVVILLTGVGTRTLVAAMQELCGRERVVTLLGRTALVARGPKPVAALREIGLAPRLTVGEPNTWRDLLLALDAQCPVEGKRVAVQEYGESNPELLAALSERGAEVLRVPVYRWALPEDVGPLRSAAERLARADVEVALFTSKTQVAHLAQVAADAGILAGVLAGTKRVVVGSIGPICSEGLRAHRLPVDFEPEHPKMGHLVAAAARRARALLAGKRQSDR